MDREQTPLKQRQKRGAASERAFRSSAAPKGRAKSAAPQDKPARPPLSILRAPPPNDGASGHPVSPKPASLYSPQQQQQPRHAMLRVSTTELASGLPNLSPSMSPPPQASAGTPLSMRKAPTNPSPPPAVASVLSRSAGSTPPPLVSIPATATKLITPSFQFASDIPTRLGSCLDLTNFTVIGSLGFEGTGKSTLLSLLARLAFESAASSEATPTDLNSLRDRSKNPHFLAQRLETQLAGLAETHGVDLAVVCEAQRLRANLGGLVLLDTQPLMSASYLAEALPRSDTAAPSNTTRYGALSAEQQNELSSFQIAILMLSVCHYVIIPQRNTAVDTEMVEFLLKIHEKMQQSRLPNVSGHVVKDKHVANLLFIANESVDGVVSHTDEKMLRALPSLLPPEWLRVNPLLWKFPTIDATSPKRSIDDWHANALSWVRFIESLPASPSFTKVPATGTSASTSPSPLSLKEWLSNTARVWESIKRSSVLTEEYLVRDNH